jgi:heme a synthase
MLVVLAGSVVRSTGSGMGCPDWPKCFGYLIPPTDREVLEWREGKSFSKGVMVIRNEALWVAVADHRAAHFDSDPWLKYEVHDYAEFNPAHTWTEYVNRLLGALSGLPVLLLFVLSLMSVRRKPLLFLLSTGVLFLLGFVAWLGKVVVDSHLTEHKITLHMVGALSIVALLTTIIRLENPVDTAKPDNRTKLLLGLGVVLALMQVFLGTQVREGVDVLMKSGIARAETPDLLPSVFFTHRTLAWAVILINIAIWLRLRRAGLRGFWALFPLLLVVVELISGVTLVYAGMPAAMQPVHLLGGFGLFASLLYWLIGSLLPRSGEALSAPASR